MPVPAEMLAFQVVEVPEVEGNCWRGVAEG
jgi:hypothetical protein